MPTLDELGRLLVEAAGLSGFMEVLQDGEQPRWWFCVDEERLLMAETDPHTGDLVVTTEVLLLGDLPDEQQAAVLKQALAYNALWQETGGARMSLLPEDESLQLMVSLPAKEQEASRVCQLLTNLLERSDDWAAALAESATADSPQRPAGGPGNLMPV